MGIVFGSIIITGSNVLDDAFVVFIGAIMVVSPSVDVCVGSFVEFKDVGTVVGSIALHCSA